MMDLEKSRRKRSSIFKKLVHSLSFPKGKIPSKSSTISLSKSKSWHCTTTTTTTTTTHDDHHHRPEQSKSSSSPSPSSSSSLNNFINKKARRRNNNKTTTHHVTPNGCFCVYVGAERQRFIIKTKYANHPLFKMLLEDAETEYGYNSEGPLLLPCEVDLFYKVLAEMDYNGGSGSEEIVIGCGSSCSPFSPARRLGNGNTTTMAANNNYSPYALLTPPRLLKINHF